MTRRIVCSVAVFKRVVDDKKNSVFLCCNLHEWYTTRRIACSVAVFKRVVDDKKNSVFRGCTLHEW